MEGQPNVEMGPHGARPPGVLGCVLVTLRGSFPGTVLGSVLGTVLGCLVVVAAVPAPASAVPTAASESGNGRYVVVLSQPPAASYRGGQPGLARTAPRPGARFDAATARVRAYTRSLVARQDRLATSVGVQPYYHYTAALNGFAAALTAAQVRSLADRPAVLGVVPDRVRHPQGWRSPGGGPASVRLGPVARLSGPSGKGVVLAVVDTGIDSGSRSFAPLGTATPAGYRGGCQHGRDTRPAARFRCTDKVVGGRFFVRGQGGADAVWSGEFLSPRDYLGHGTRTASAAAGETTHATVRGVRLGRTSGTAPDAAVASYKVCWAAEDGGDSCLTSDTLAGIDRAVADGVDVLAFGVSGTSDDVVDPVELAFLHAADAGVFVATAAGNRGPGPGSTGHPSPWTATVGAASRAAHAATVVLGDDEHYVGVSVTTDDVARAPLVLARDAAAVGVDPSDAQLCLPGSLDRATVAGAIAVCDRGTSDRVDKSAVVDAAGGVGMLLLNPTADSLDADPHAVPTVHLPDTAYAGIYAYAGGGEHATASIRAGVGRPEPVPAAIAPFSGRGPTPAAGGDLLKPDLVGPGVDVLTATASGAADDPPAGGFGLSSGTSVAAASVAGQAARLVQAHPAWSPMAVKSALMTTAHELDGSPFDQGAGLVRPRRALDPGLVVETTMPDWESYLAGQGRDGLSAAAQPAADLNVASVAIGRLAGHATVHRTVTNVGDSAATYSVATRGLDGISVTAVPSVFTVRPGAQQTIALTFVRDNAELGRYVTGAVRLNDGGGGHLVRLPVAVRPVGVVAPHRVRLDRPGGTSVRTRSGIRGTLVARVRGPVAGVDSAADGSDTDGADFSPALSGLWSQTVDVAGPGELLRVQALADDRGDDLDLFLLDASGDVVSSADTGAASEALTVHGLAAGTYTIDVQPWFVADPSGDTTFTVRTFQVSPRASGSVLVEPRRQGVSPGRANTWSLLVGRRPPGTSWFGRVGWYAGDQVVARTLVRAD